MFRSRVFWPIVLSLVITSSFLGAYAVTSIVAPETPRGGDEASGGFINNAEITDTDKVQIIVNFTTTATDLDRGAAADDILTLLQVTRQLQLMEIPSVEVVPLSTNLPHLQPLLVREKNRFC